MKTFFQTLLLTGILFILCLQNAQAGEILKIVPGKSMGPVSLGEGRAKLLDLGFGPDGATDPQEYLQYNGVLVRLSDDKVAQIYADAKTLKRLRFHNKKLPKDTSAKSLKTFFQHCGRQIKTSAGILVYCEKHGIELTYGSMKGQLQGLAIVANKTGKPSKSAKSKKSELTKALPKKIVKKPKKTTPLPEKTESAEVPTTPKQDVKEPAPPPAQDEKALEQEVESMPSQPEVAPPVVAPVDAPAPADSATTPEEKATDLPYED